MTVSGNGSAAVTEVAAPAKLNLALLVILVIGLAPGLRDLLRMLCGT